MKELIELAKKKGFVSSHFIYSYPDTDLNKYLWMCEMQKWLRDKHNLFVFIEIDNNLNEHGWAVRDKEDMYLVGWDWMKISYEEALKAGLTEALKLI